MTDERDSLHIRRGTPFITQQRNRADKLALFDKWIQRVARWRKVFASWQLGTRSDTDPECRAVKDHREATIMLRVDFNAITTLLLEKGIITLDEIRDAMTREAEILDKTNEGRFPGFKSTDEGLTMDVALTAQTMKSWLP